MTKSRGHDLAMFLKEGMFGNQISDFFDSIKHFENHEVKGKDSFSSKKQFKDTGHRW